MHHPTSWRCNTKINRMDFCQTSLFAIGVAGRAALVYMAVGMMVGIPALAFTTDDAGTIFNSYTKAFYSLDGTNGYFKGDQVGGVADFWMQAEEIECVIDACEGNSN